MPTDEQIREGIFIVQQGCIHEGGSAIAAFLDEKEALDYAQECVDLENELRRREQEAMPEGLTPEVAHLLRFNQGMYESKGEGYWDDGMDYYVVFRQGGMEYLARLREKANDDGYFEFLRNYFQERLSGLKEAGIV